MQVQFEGRNNTRAGSINIATLPHSYTHCAPSSFSPNEREECTKWSYCTIERLYDLNNKQFWCNFLDDPQHASMFNYELKLNHKSGVYMVMQQWWYQWQTSSAVPSLPIKWVQHSQPWKKTELRSTIFIRIISVATINCWSAATNRGQLLFEGGFY